MFLILGLERLKLALELLCVLILFFAVVFLVLAITVRRVEQFFELLVLVFTLFGKLLLLLFDQLKPEVMLGFILDLHVFIYRLQG